MTRKDYIKIAAVFRVAAVLKGADPDNVWSGLVEDMVTMLYQDNPRFNRAKFYKACGLGVADWYKERRERGEGDG